MKKLLIATVSIIALTAVSAVYEGLQLRAQSHDPQKSTQAEDSPSLGKKVFVARCASCHGEDGSKALADGSFLIQRLARKSDLESALAGRLRKLPEEERRDVLQYVRGLVDRFRSSNSIPKNNQ